MKKSKTLDCPHCGTGLRLFGIERHAIIDGMVLRSYVCPACDAVHTDLVATRHFGIAVRKNVPERVVDLLGNCGFDDATTSLLGATFDKAWTKLKVAGGPLTSEPLAPATRELLARCIIALGRRAAAESDGLDDKALVFLAYLTQGILSPLATAARRPARPRS